MGLLSRPGDRAYRKNGQRYEDKAAEKRGIQKYGSRSVSTGMIVLLDDEIEMPSQLFLTCTNFRMRFVCWK